MKEGGRKKEGRNRSPDVLSSKFLQGFREDILGEDGRKRALTFVKSKPRSLLFEQHGIQISGRKNQQLIDKMLEDYLIEKHNDKMLTLTFLGFLKLLCLNPLPESDTVRMLTTGLGVLQPELEKEVKNYNSWIREVKELVKTAAKHFQHPLFEKCELFEDNNPSYSPPSLKNPKLLSRIYYVYYDAAEKLLLDTVFWRNIEKIKERKKEVQKLVEERKELEKLKNQRGKKGRWKRASLRLQFNGVLHEETLKDFITRKVEDSGEKIKFQKHVIKLFERGLLLGYADKFLSLCSELDIVMPKDQDLYNAFKNAIQSERMILEKQLENLQRIEHLVEEAKP